MLAHRKAAIATALSVVGLGLAGGWLAAGVVDSRGTIGAAPYATSAPVLPDRMGVSGPVPASVTQQPAGPAIAAYLDDDDDQQWWVFVSARRSAYRKHGDGGYYPNNKNEMLLSPDGTHAAVPAFDAERAGWVDILNLVTGDERRVSGLRLTSDDAPLSWSPDNRHLALTLGDRIAIADVTTGEVRQLQPLATEAAYSPAGDRIALSHSGSVSVVDTGTGRVRKSYPVGNLVVAPAGWSPDGSTIALQPPEHPSDQPTEHAAAERSLARLDLASGKVLQAGGGTIGTTAVAWRSNTVLVVTAPGRPTLSAYDVSSDQVSMVSINASDWYSTAHGLRMATGLAPTMQIVTARRVDRGHAYTWYAVWPLAIILMAIVGRKWPRPKSPRRKSDGYLWFTGLLTTPAMAALVVVPILIIFEVLMYGGHLDSLGLAGFSYLLACLLATTLLGAAALIAGLLSRPFEGSAPVSQLPQPLFSTTG